MKEFKPKKRENLKIVFKEANRVQGLEMFLLSLPKVPEAYKNKINIQQLITEALDNLENEIEDVGAKILDEVRLKKH